MPLARSSYLLKRTNQANQIKENSGMNIDYGFFHLLTALRSMRNSNSFDQIQESPSAVEPKLPDIDHSLLRRTFLHQDRAPRRILTVRDDLSANAACYPVHGVTVIPGG
jgi:hypothetical protein